MRHYLVVAHQTLDSPQLLDTMRDRMSHGPCTFHLVVPVRHDHRFTWSEGQVNVEAERHLEAARLRFVNLGLPVTGEVGHSNPVQSVNSALLRQPPGHYTEIIVSTLPARLSRWLGLEVPTRIRKLTRIPVTSVAAPATVDA